ncbi:MAG: hypothetical protein HKN47_23160 [Pirellulaceae bacterium]|nr:hypothetical protein [Pirellulaceae bacterium]
MMSSSVTHSAWQTHSGASAGSDRSSAQRIMLAKVGLDGHDRGIKVVARGLRDAGFHVIYGGIWQSPEAVAQAALDEDADWLGLSLLSGAHMTLVPRVLDAIHDSGNQRTRVMLGGIIPEDDIGSLEKMGIHGVFGPGSSIETIAKFLRSPPAETITDPVESLVAGAASSDRKSLSKLLTLVSKGLVDSDMFNATNNGKRIPTVALTGSGGVGKSSLIAEVLQSLSQQGVKIAVLACDPQSPFTGGALLGDRVRMGGSNAGDSQTLIRSLAVPSGHQGVAEHLETMIVALKSFGFDLIMIESVGVGQGDVAIGQFVDRVIVLLQPESGDSVQWEKAGLLEIADAIVIQKCDLPGADMLESELQQHLNLPGHSQIPILRVSAANKSGIDELCQLIMN